MRYVYAATVVSIDASILMLVILRYKETRAAELLFLPRKREAKTKEQKGSRNSRRLLKQQLEKAASLELAGELESK
jgi:hypothetical protein